MNRAPISSHHTFDDPRYWTFARTSGLPHGTFHESLGERIERMGNRALSIVMTVAALFIVAGLTFGWIS